MADNDQTTSTPDTGSGDDTLGAGGIKALEAERKLRREAEQRAHQAENRARELELANERRDVATAKGLTADQAKYLTGDTREELEQAADGLLAAFGKTPDAEGDPTSGKGKSRPKEKLWSGAMGPDHDDPSDAAKIADSILSRN